MPERSCTTRKKNFTFAVHIVSKRSNAGRKARCVVGDRPRDCSFAHSPAVCVPSAAITKLYYLAAVGLLVPIAQQAAVQLTVNHNIIVADPRQSTADLCTCNNSAYKTSWCL